MHPRKRVVVRKKAKVVGKKIKLIAETKALLHKVTRVSDPRKHHEFDKLNYASLKKMGFTLPVLHNNFHLRIGDLYRIKVPVKELINFFGLGSVLGYTEFAAPLRQVIPMRELRKAGVKASELLNKKMPFGALFHYGNYTRKELLEAGVSIENLNRLGKKGKTISTPPKRKPIK